MFFFFPRQWFTPFWSIWFYQVYSEIVILAFVNTFMSFWVVSNFVSCLFISPFSFCPRQISHSKRPVCRISTRLTHRCVWFPQTKFFPQLTHKFADFPYFGHINLPNYFTFDRSVCQISLRLTHQFSKFPHVWHIGCQISSNPYFLTFDTSVWQISSRLTNQFAGFPHGWFSVLPDFLTFERPVSGFHHVWYIVCRISSRLTIRYSFLFYLSSLNVLYFKQKSYLYRKETI